VKFPFARFAAKWFNKYYIEQLVLFVTSRCNLKCSFCFYYEEIDAANAAKELTLADHQKLAKSMWPFYILNIGGGEPMLRADLADVCGAYIENCSVKQLVIPTNGFYTAKVVDTVTKIVSRYPQTSLALIISIDGTRELHDKIRGLPGSYDKLIETYKALLPVREKYPNLSLLSGTTMMRDNEHDAVNILKHLDEKYDFNDQILGIVRFKSRDAGALTVALDNYRRGIMFLLERKMRRSHMSVPVWMRKVLLIKDIMRYRVILDLLGRGKFTTPCYAGKLAVTISEEGRMAECEIRQTEIGNVRDVGMDFNKLYFTEKREKIAQQQLDEQCTCTYECYLPFNILLHPMSLPRIVKASIATLLRRNPEKFIFDGTQAELLPQVDNTFHPPPPAAPAA
jgi:MoaA/NifB/PqqE/SkfB family radical SAM enzyme